MCTQLINFVMCTAMAASLYFFAPQYFIAIWVSGPFSLQFPITSDVLQCQLYGRTGIVQGYIHAYIHELYVQFSGFNELVLLWRGLQDACISKQTWFGNETRHLLLLWLHNIKTWQVFFSSSIKVISSRLDDLCWCAKTVKKNPTITDWKDIWPWGFEQNLGSMSWKAVLRFDFK